MQEHDFDAIRPYFNHEIPLALDRIVSDPMFQQLMNYLFAKEEHDELRNKLLKSTTTNEFQKYFMTPVIKSILEKTSVELVARGIDKLDHSKGYVYIANHRDIILDSAILGISLVQHGLETSHITWGNNLMISPFIVDVGKANRMITVFRDGSPKEMLKNSQRLSAYIRHLVKEKNKSVWIAQRKGRSKDGFDMTDDSVLKMLSLSGEDNVIDSLEELNIVPVTISYEWEPCDRMKVREMYISQNGNGYVKDKNEDLFSIIGGVVSEKGRIHLEIGSPINQLLDSLDTNRRPNEIIHDVAAILDKKIHASYKLWPSNYLAYDLLEKTDKFKDMYDDQIKDKLNERLNKTYETVDGDPIKTREMFLKLYANPVYIKLGTSPEKK
jgi:glycerol-3-phosphate O-acyltransferase